MHVSLIHILSILQLIQEDILDAGNDKNEKEEVIKRKIPYILKRQLYENKPRRPYILKRGSYYYWKDKYFIYMWLSFLLMKYHYICVEMWQSTIILSLLQLWFIRCDFFCITINWTKCLKINLDLEHEVLCIIGIDIN